MAQTLQLGEAAGQALALVEAGTLFADIGTLGANWRKLAAAVNAAPAITDGPAFVRWLLAHLDDDDTTALFTAANLAPLLASLRAAEARVKTVLPGAERLLAPLSSFDEVETAHTDLPQGWIDGANPGLVSLSPGAIARSLPVGSDLSVSFSASGAIECEAGALWPFKGDGLSGGLLRISARGDLAAGASFALPFAWGKLGASASGEAKPAVHYFFDQKVPGEIYAAALAQALPGLPDPFDPASVWRAFALSGLRGMILTFDGNATVGVDLALGKEFDWPGVLGAGVSATINVALVRKAAFQLSLRALGDAAHSNLALVARMSRNSTAQDDWGLGLGLTVDAGPIFTRVHEILSAQLQGIDAVVDQITPFLTPGTWLTTHAADALNTLIGHLTQDAALRGALEQDAALLLGQSSNTDSGLGQFLTGQIASAIDKGAGLVSGGADAWVAAVFDSLTGAVPALGATAIEARLKADLGDLVGRVQQGVQLLATSLLGQAGGLGAIEAGLAKVGVATGAAGSDLDKALAGVKALVVRYDALLHKVVDFTADTAKARISARLIYEHKQSQSAQYEISGRFATLAGAAGGLYRGLVFGQLGAIQAALKTPVAGFAIDPAASSITNFSQTDESLGYEVVLFGLQLTGAALLSSNAQVVLTGDGAVRIAAQGSYTVSQKALGASRSLGFSTSYAFADAKRDGAAGRPVIKLGLAAARADSDLTLGEVTGFLDRLVQNRLIADARRTRAAQIYNGWAATRGTSTKLPGSIALELNFNANDVAALLRAGSALADPPDGAAPAIDLFARAVSAMTCTGEWSASDRHDQVGDLTTVSEFARIQQQHPSEAAFLYQICLEQRLNTVLGLGVARGGGSRPTSYALPRLLELPDKAQAGFAFTRLIGGLARLDAASVPADGAQAAQLFSALERQIADQAGWWLKLGGVDFLACSKRLQPRTVALFLALASLARGVPPDAPGASFDDMFTLSLTRENQSATLVV